MFDLKVTKKKNICILGHMGSGKSIIGKDLSNYLNLKYYDIDKEIELNTRKSIKLIFEEKGEKYFRNIEEKICLKLLTKNNCVISLGGGSIINKKITEDYSSSSSVSSDEKNPSSKRRARTSSGTTLPCSSKNSGCNLGAS